MVLAVPGMLEVTFGAGGQVITPIGYVIGAWSIVLQPDCKIVAFGESETFLAADDTSFALARYNSYGTLDPTFGEAGMVVTPFADQGIQNWAFCMAIQPDGKIVVSGINISPELQVVRYNSDGSPDTGFGASGIVSIAIGTNATAYGLVPQPDVKIVIAGNSTNAVTGFSACLLARFNSNGGLPFYETDSNERGGGGGCFIEAL